MLNYLPLNQIVHGCQQRQEEKCFELFRRAFDEQDQEAATAVYHQYKMLVFNWVHKALASYPLSEQDVEDIANEALTKFIKHLNRGSIVARYDHVAQLLAYCKRCVQTTVIDFRRRKVRQAQRQDEWVDQLLIGGLSVAGPSKEIERQELCRNIQELVKKHVTDPQEMRYLELKFVYGFTSRQMVACFPDEFPDSKTTYKVWDRLKKRLKKVFEIYLK